MNSRGCGRGCRDRNAALEHVSGFVRIVSLASGTELNVCVDSPFVQDCPDLEITLVEDRGSSEACGAQQERPLLRFAVANNFTPYSSFGARTGLQTGASFAG